MGTKFAENAGKIARQELQYMTKGTAGIAKNGTLKRFVPDANAQCHQNKEIFMLFCTTFPREPCYEQHFLEVKNNIKISLF